MSAASARPFTGLRDPAAEALLAGALPRIAAAVRGFATSGGPGSRIVSVAMGGGYGRGEGGVRNGKLCNDVDFYTVVSEETSAAEMDAIASALGELAAPFTAELGAEVEFSYPKRPSRIRHDERRVMIQELVRGHVPVYGEDIATFAPKFPAECVPAIEAARLLMNRGMGLLFAAERMDSSGAVSARDGEFFLRNANKAVLGAGDARLIARGEYAWAIRDRAARVATAAYDAAVAEKFAPTRTLPADARPMWNAAREDWRDAYGSLLAARGDELSGRSLWEAARWIGRRRTLGDVTATGLDCTVRVLRRVAAALDAETPVLAAGLRRDWEIFN